MKRLSFRSFILKTQMQQTKIKNDAETRKNGGARF